MSIVNDKPTPETDNFITSQNYSPTDHQWRNFARKLERERDEALRNAAMWKANHDNQVALKAMLMERPDLGDRAARIAELIRERDEVQKAVNGLCDHFGVSPANTTLLAVEVLRIQREREEAITRRMETIMQCELYEQERDEAREALKYIAHSGLSARHIEDYAKDFLSKK